MKNLIALASLVSVLAAPVMAEQFQTVKSKNTFVDLISNKHLTRFGIKLAVRPTGEIEGKAFGRPVTGAWRWDSGYFCRDLFWGSRDLGPNCQMVKADGDTLRFISDKGAGQFADLELD
jgi:hypothetical protein